MDDYKFNEIILKDVIVLITSITYFDKSVFIRPNLMRHLLNHFKSDAEWAKIRKSVRRKEPQMQG